MRSIDMIPAGCGGGHVKVVAEHDPPEAQSTAQDVSDPRSRESCGTVIQTFEHDMGGHDARQVRCSETFERNEIREPEILVRPAVDGKRAVRIGCDAPVPREVFSHSTDPRVSHSREERAGKHGHDVGVPMERAVTDHRARTRTEIENRCKAEVDSTGTQLDRHHPSAATCGTATENLISVVENSVFRRSGKSRESVPESLHSTAFVVNRDEQRRPSQCVNGIAQGT